MEYLSTWKTHIYAITIRKETKTNRTQKRHLQQQKWLLHKQQQQQAEFWYGWRNTWTIICPCKRICLSYEVKYS